MIEPKDVSALILAGGQGRRMRLCQQDSGGQAAADPASQEKGLMRLHGEPLVSWAVCALPASLDAVYISANRCFDAYARFGTVVSDEPDLGPNLGPLAGVASVLSQMPTPWLYVVPVDVPRPPADVFDHLLHHVNEQVCHLAYIHADRPEPLFMLVNQSLLDSLRHYLRGGCRQVQGWQREHGHAVHIRADHHAFLNVNTPAQLRQAHRTILSDCHHSID